MREGTLDGFEQRIEHVLALIATNLGEPLPLRRPASEAALSPCLSSHLACNDRRTDWRNNSQVTVLPPGTDSRS